MLSLLRRYIREDSPLRLAYSQSKSFLARLLSGNPSQDLIVIGVTGTDGKTSSSHFTAELLELLGETVAMSSTEEIWIAGDHRPNVTKRTTLSPSTVQSFLSEARKQGCRIAIIEVSSHALVQGRVAGVDFDIGILTNISREHTNYHHTMDAYAEAKSRLFHLVARSPKQKKRLFLNISTQYFELFQKIAPEITSTYGLSEGADMRAVNLIIEEEKTDFILSMTGGQYDSMTERRGAEENDSDRTEENGVSSPLLGGTKGDFGSVETSDHLHVKGGDWSEAEAGGLVSEVRQTPQPSFALPSVGSALLPVALTGGLRAELSLIERNQTETNPPTPLNRGATKPPNQNHLTCISSSHFLPATLNIPGAYNVENILASISVACFLGHTLESIVEKIPMIHPVAGRLEGVENPLGLQIYIDFAVTPGAFERLLDFARKTTKGGVILVFGATGANHDHDKRPMLGEIASRLADQVFLTEDETYGEDNEVIMKEVEKGFHPQFHSYEKVANRGEAIRKALASAKSGDTVLITGMGAFTSRNNGKGEIEWSDRGVVEEWIESRG